MGKILVVDDFEDSRYSLCRLLELCGHTVVEASNGHQAVEAALSEQPDLVLMDLSLPGIDGIAATARIRAASGIRQMPIVALSAHDTESYHTAALGAGCDAYLTKPMDFDDLEKLIGEILDKEPAKGA